MIGWWKHFREKWDDWCGDHDMEIAIRKHLSDQGYYGGTAKLRKVRLVAIQRPGWLQVFRFEATARIVPNEEKLENEPDEARYDDLFGLVKDDIRHKINVVRVFADESERVVLFQRWSKDLICLRGAHGLIESAKNTKTSS